MFWKIQDSRHIKHTENTQIKSNSEKQTMQNKATQNYPGLVASYDTRPGNESGLFYEASETTHTNLLSNVRIQWHIWQDKRSPASSVSGRTMRYRTKQIRRFATWPMLPQRQHLLTYSSYTSVYTHQHWVHTMQSYTSLLEQFSNLNRTLQLFKTSATAMYTVVFLKLPNKIFSDVESSLA